MEGDVSIEGLGLVPEDAEEISRNVEYVIHSAAAVALDDPIKKTLINNYVSTQNVLKICEGISKLRAYVHISTAYVNITFPPGSTVKEKIYPLQHGDRVCRMEYRTAGIAWFEVATRSCSLTDGSGTECW